MLTKADYEGALQVQDACNLAGVVRSFRDLMFKLTQEADWKGKGLEYVHHHPITRLYISKIEHLTGYAKLNVSKELQNVEEIVCLAVRFRNVVLELCKENQGTTWVNHHPRCQAFCARLMELSELTALSEAQAYEAVVEVIAEFKRKEQEQAA